MQQIKRKAFKYVKKLRCEKPQTRETKLQAVKSAINLAISQGKSVILTDEAMFTTATLIDRGYARKGINIHLFEKLMSSPAIAVVAVVRTRRVEAFYI